MAITDCAFVRFRMTVFQGRAFSQGLVWRHAPKPVEPRASTPKFSVHEYHVRVGGRVVGGHRVLALPRGSRVRLDSLVDRAAEINARIAAEQLDHSVVRPRVVEMYERNLTKARS